MFSGSTGASSGWTISNLRIVNNLSYGIYSDSCCNTYANLTVSSDQQGIYNDSVNGGNGCCNIYTNVVANNNNSRDGIYANGCCNTATDVTANGNFSIGIEFEIMNSSNPVGNNSIIDSIANSNGNGIKNEGLNNSYRGTTTNGNDSDGLINSSGQGRIDHAVANGNGATGIVAFGDNTLVTNSTANNNAEVGIEVGATGGNNSVTDVVARSNGTFGVQIPCPGHVTSINATANKCADLCAEGTCTELDNNAPVEGCGPC